MSWESSRDVTALSEDCLRRDLALLAQEERELAARLELVRGRIALVKAGLAGRGLATLEAGELARVLLGEARDENERGRGEF